MDTARWKLGDEFVILDLVAKFEFKTATSLSFELGKTVDRDSPRLPEMSPAEDDRDFLLDTGSAFVVIGWLDAHYPCDGFHLLRLRVGLPDRYVSCESMCDLVPQVVEALGLPSDVAYQVSLSGLSEQVCTEKPPSPGVFFNPCPWWQPLS